MFSNVKLSFMNYVFLIVKGENRDGENEVSNEDKTFQSPLVSISDVNQVSRRSGIPHSG